MKVPFNEPYLPSSGLAPILKDPDLLRTQGKYYQQCIRLIQQELKFQHIILTPSCTSALELIALTLKIEEGDEVILPSYTYVSTANAFALRGAKLVFVDTYSHHPSIDIDKIEKAITKKTKAIVVVHYGGIAVEYNKLKKLKRKYKVPLVEDAAHCMGAKSDNGELIGSLGDFATFSFHETKNISCGQGGAVIINNPRYLEAANIVAQCGTNKIDFIRKKVDFYSWKSVGSNFLLAEPLCAILLANLRLMSKINQKRIGLAKSYHAKLLPLEKSGKISLSPFDKNGNGHIFYLLTKNPNERKSLIQYLNQKGVEATFHYSPLHQASYIIQKRAPKELKNTEFISERIIRLPMYFKLSSEKQNFVVAMIQQYFS